MGCADCPYYVEGLRDENDQLCCACTKMPSNKPCGCGYMEINGIDHIKERMWFCPLSIPEITNNRLEVKAGGKRKMISKCYWTLSEDFCIQAEIVNDTAIYKVYNGWGEHLATFKSFDAADAFIVQQEQLLQNNSVTEEKQ